MSLRRDLQLTHRARRAGARHAFKIVRAARDTGVPVSWALALVEQESGFRNIFGCDQGSILCHQKVTRARVRALLQHIGRGGVSNGVGLTQLTFPEFIRRAERAGGAHKPRVQVRVGLRVFREMTGGDFDRNAWKYNGSTAYQPKIEAKQRRWHAALT